jgi:predicted amidophosphoribosyltransferase
MKQVRPATPGTARVCPHCKATILESASVCPVCRHHLRFDPNATERRPTLTPLRVEGTIRQYLAEVKARGLITGRKER